jgi:hypothetical protein
MSRNSDFGKGFVAWPTNRNAWIAKPAHQIVVTCLILLACCFVLLVVIVAANRVTPNLLAMNCVFVAQTVLIHVISIVAAFSFLRRKMRGQFRMGLLELMAIIMLLSVGVGVIVQRLQTVPQRSEQLMQGIPMALILLLWVGGGALWGMWAANRLEIQCPWRRLGIMAMGWLFPLAVIAFGLATASLVAALAGNVATIAFVLAYVPAVIQVYYAARIHNSAPPLLPSYTAIRPDHRGHSTRSR